MACSTADQITHQLYIHSSKASKNASRMGVVKLHRLVFTDAHHSPRFLASSPPGPFTGVATPLRPCHISFGLSASRAPSIERIGLRLSAEEARDMEEEDDLVKVVGL